MPPPSSSANKPSPIRKPHNLMNQSSPFIIHLAATVVSSVASTLGKSTISMLLSHSASFSFDDQFCERSRPSILTESRTIIASNSALVMLNSSIMLQLFIKSRINSKQFLCYCVKPLQYATNG